MILFFKDTILVWATQLSQDVIQIRLCTFRLVTFFVFFFCIIILTITKKNVFQLFLLIQCFFFSFFFLLLLLYYLSSIYRSMLVILSNSRISVSYLGTEPSLFRLPAPQTRFINFQQRYKEFIELEALIRKKPLESVEGIQFFC